MIKIEAIVREEKLEDVKDALNKIEVTGITVFQVMGCGVQKGYTERIRGQEVDFSLRPKVKFEIVVSTEEWERKTIKAIQESAYTGNVGDGKIFSYDMRSVMRIRTKETGTAAIN
ncbi:MAG: P-II family nitrogen regulator [Acidobacteriota bacterium]|jgi:nitrogen regulatory protein P-II 1|nr:P-II family nitrogen regulator [Acidobacteriota bacterium]